MDGLIIKKEWIKKILSGEKKLKIRGTDTKKCELCGKLTMKRVVIKNKISGKELRICNKCITEFGFK